MPTSETSLVQGEPRHARPILLQGGQVERPRVVGHVLDPGQVLAQHHDVTGVGDEDDGCVLGDDLAGLTIQLSAAALSVVSKA